MNNTKKMIQHAIYSAIDYLKNDIYDGVLVEENEARARAIKTLTEAYSIVKRGPKNEKSV